VSVSDMPDWCGIFRWNVVDDLEGARSINRD